MTDTAPGKTLTTVKTEVAPVIMAMAEKKACNTFKTISVVTLFGPRKPKHKLKKVYLFIDKIKDCLPELCEWGRVL